MTLEQALVIVVSADVTLTAADKLGSSPVRFYPIIARADTLVPYAVYTPVLSNPITTQDIALCDLREWDVQIDIYAEGYGACRILANQMKATLVKFGLYDGISSAILNRDMSMPEEPETKLFHIVLEICFMESLA